MVNKKANIEEKALKLINDYSKEIGRPIKPPIPVFEIIEFLGYDVDFRKDGLYEDHNYLGGLLIDEKIVELNENLSNQEVECILRLHMRLDILFYMQKIV